MIPNSTEPQKLTPEVDPVLSQIAATAWDVTQAEDPTQLANLLLNLAKQYANKEQDFSSLKELLKQNIQRAEQLQRVLEDVLNQVNQLETRQIYQERFTEDWWIRKQTDLIATMQADSNQGQYAWLSLYTELLLAWRLGLCERLVADERTRVNIPYVLFYEGTQALKTGFVSKWLRDSKTREKKISYAMEMVQYLLDNLFGRTNTQVVDSLQHALLLILAGRIHLEGTNDHSAATFYFDKARETVPDDGRPLAAMGDVQRVADKLDEAAELYEKAIELSPDQAEGFVGFGLWSEAQKFWNEADDWYQQAIEVLRERPDVQDLTLALTGLLAPVTGNLYFQLAHVLKEDASEEALKAVDLADHLGVTHVGARSSHSTHRLKGEILEKLGRPLDAAQVYLEAGRRWETTAEAEVALELLRRSKELNPERKEVNWYLADALRSRSWQRTWPGVDPALVKEALKIWQQSEVVGLPSSDNSWAYVVRALISDNMAQVPDEYPQRRQWRHQGTAYLERDILHWPKDADRRAQLVDIHTSADNCATALDGLDDALKVNATNTMVLQVAARVLVSFGRYTDAFERLEELRKQLQANADQVRSEVDLWIKSIEAYINLYGGEARKGLELINQCIEVDPDNTWYRQIRSDIWRRMGDDEQAQQDSRFIYEHITSPMQRKQDPAYAWAAFHTGRVQEALALYSELATDSLANASALRSIGVIHLTQGNLAGGEEDLLRGIQKATTIVELDSLLVIELPDLKRLMTDQELSNPLQDVLARVESAIDVQRSNITNRSALDELSELVRLAEQGSERDTWTWVSAQAGRARILSKQGEWYEAALTYRRLLDETPKEFPEATIAIKNCASELRTAGDQQLKEGAAAAALEIYQKSQTIGQDVVEESAERIGALYARFGMAHFQLGDTEIARGYFEQALQTYERSETTSPGTTLGAECQALLRDVAEYWRLKDNWTNWRASLADDDLWQESITEAVNALDEFVAKLYRLAPSTDEYFIPVVTPIILEVGDAIVPKVDSRSDGGKFLYEYIPAMRQRIQDTVGVSVTGVRARGSSAMPNAYRIKLDEILVTSGTVQIDWSFCAASPDTVTELGISTIVKERHPLWGITGCWISQEDVEIATAKGLLVISDAMFIIYHLEAVLRQNLANFLGIQEVEKILDTYEKNKQKRDLIQTVLPNPDTKLRFARLLRALVSEQVPIVALDEIFDVVKGSSLATNDIGQMLHRVRLRLRASLPGNRGHRTKIEVPIDLEDEMAQWVLQMEGQSALAMPLEPVHKLLVHIGELMPSSVRAVLITRRVELRPLLWHLVKTAFPYLPVLSEDEVLSNEAPLDEPLGGIQES